MGDSDSRPYLINSMNEFTPFSPIEELKLHGTNWNARNNKNISTITENELNVKEYFKERKDGNYTYENQERLEKSLKNITKNEVLIQNKINEIIIQLKEIQERISHLNRNYNGYIQ